MQKLIILLFILTSFSCAMAPLKPEVLQKKIGVGMNLADVIGIMGLPNEKKAVDADTLQLSYDTYVLRIFNSQLSSIQVLEKSQLRDLMLQPILQIKPDYKTDSIILNKDPSLAASAYQAAVYLQDESLFVKAAEAGINPNGFTVRSNAVCLAITHGFLNGLEAVIQLGYNKDLQLRTDKGVYMFPRTCITFQKNMELAQLIQKRFEAEDKAESEPTQVGENSEVKKKNSKSFFDWEAFKEFMKPVKPNQPTKPAQPSQVPESSTK